MRNDPIGIFDSGAGGLNVLDACKAVMPRERYVYLADYANMPYGEKPPDVIVRCADNCAKTLFGMGCKAVLAACNTATATAIDDLRATYQGRIIVGLEPAIMPCLRELGRREKAVALVTPATFRSARFARLIAETDGAITAVAAPELAALIERSLGEHTDKQVGEYIFRLLEKYRGVSAVVLGCSHYSYAVGHIKRVLGDVRIYDGAQGAARRMLYCLQLSDLVCDCDGGGQVTYINT